MHCFISAPSKFRVFIILRPRRYRNSNALSEVLSQTMIAHVWIQDLVKGSPASETKNCQCSRVESFEQNELSAVFGILMLKCAFSHILETIFLSFLTSTYASTPKLYNLYWLRNDIYAKQSEAGQFLNFNSNISN